VCRQVYNVLWTEPQGNEGVGVKRICERVAGAQEAEVAGAAQQLVDEGLIYTTVDENTFAVVECW
jgi:replication factor A2